MPTRPLSNRQSRRRTVAVLLVTATLAPFGLLAGTATIAGAATTSQLPSATSLVGEATNLIDELYYPVYLTVCAPFGSERLCPLPGPVLLP